MFASSLYKRVIVTSNEGDVFRYLRTICPRITNAKITECVVVGQQIRHVINDKRFEDLNVGKEKITWMASTDIVEKFLRTPENYVQMVNKHASSIKIMKCDMSFLH